MNVSVYELGIGTPFACVFIIAYVDKDLVRPKTTILISVSSM